MGYSLDLDEYEEERLMGELQRRAYLRKKGLCDYCERTGDTKSCKFPNRHMLAKKERKMKLEQINSSVVPIVELHEDWDNPPTTLQNLRPGHKKHFPGEMLLISKNKEKGCVAGTIGKIAWGWLDCRGSIIKSHEDAVSWILENNKEYTQRNLPIWDYAYIRKGEKFVLHATFFEEFPFIDFHQQIKYKMETEKTQDDLMWIYQESFKFLCGCGCPDDVLELILLTLKKYNNNEDALPEDTALGWSFLYFLDTMELTDHGSIIHRGFLTDKGKRFLSLLEKHGTDTEKWEKTIFEGNK